MRAHVREYDNVAKVLERAFGRYRIWVFRRWWVLVLNIDDRAGDTLLVTCILERAFDNHPGSLDINEMPVSFIAEKHSTLNNSSVS